MIWTCPSDAQRIPKMYRQRAVRRLCCHGYVYGRTRPSPTGVNHEFIEDYFQKHKAHPRGFIIPAFIPLSRAHRGCPRSRGTRRLVRVAEQRGSMSSSGLDRERKCGASGEENSREEKGMEKEREREVGLIMSSKFNGFHPTAVVPRLARLVRRMGTMARLACCFSRMSFCLECSHNGQSSTAVRSEARSVLV
ncbi:uncharacterized protein V6R79_010328 [Siganus canaliculatus]